MASTDARPVIGALLMVLFPLAAHGYTVPPSGRLHFEILRDGGSVGTECLTFTREGETLRVERSARIDVSVWWIPAYSYRYWSESTWRGDTLRELRSRTNDNGTRYRVDARTTSGGLRVDTGEVRTYSQPRVTPTNYWNDRLVNSPHLLDTQFGRLLSVESTRKGTEEIQAEGRSLEATHYEIRGDLNLDLWYDGTGRWVKLAFNRGGSRFEYRLLERPCKVRDWGMKP